MHGSGPCSGRRGCRPVIRRQTENTMTRLVIAGARVFDGTGADIHAADIAIEGGRIADVGPGLVGDERIDGAGITVLPGLFDCHVHAMFGVIDVWQLAQRPLSYRYFEAATHLAATLAVGITTNGASSPPANSINLPMTS